MDMTGEFRIPAPRQKVWEALNDPDDPEAEHPGLRGDREAAPTPRCRPRSRPRSVRCAPRFGGKVTLSDLDPPNGYKITGEGSGGAAGFAKGGATVRLADDGDGTRLTYTVEAHVGGKLAQIGSRLIDATARKMADEFFSRFAASSMAAEPPPAPLPCRAAPRPAPAPVAPRRADGCRRRASRCTGAGARPPLACGVGRAGWSSSSRVLLYLFIRPRPLKRPR